MSLPQDSFSRFFAPVIVSKISEEPQLSPPPKLPQTCIQFPEVPGQYKATTFVMEGNPASYAFLVETIDTDLFELTIFTIDAQGGRTEHVIHCPSQGLILLSQGIATTLYQYNKTKELIQKDL